MEWANIRQALALLARGVGEDEHNQILDAILQLIRTDPVFAQLLARRPSSDPYEDRHRTRGRQAVVWRDPRNDQNSPLSSEERLLCGEGDRGDVGAANPVHAYRSVELRHREQHVSQISVDDVWECRYPATMSRAPRDPHVGMSIGRVCSSALCGQ